MSSPSQISPTAPRNMLRAFTLAPRRVPKSSLSQLAALQPINNALYDAVASDPEFLEKALGDAGTACSTWSTVMPSSHALTLAITLCGDGASSAWSPLSPPPAPLSPLARVR